jgi:uncharacterized membrane protein YeiB
MSEITRRRVAPDVTRAIALIGVVVMNYHGSMNDVRHPSGFWNHLFHPYTGVLSTRFAATFVVVAGVSVSLMSRSNDIAQRSRLLRRGLVLYAAGLALNHAWGGTIIFYYGAYLMIAAIVVKWSTRRLVALSVAAILISASLSAWLATRGTRTIGWLDPPRIDSLADLVGRTFTGYTHPVFPWIAFFAVGMIIGRHYESFERSARKVVVIAAGMVAIVYVVVHLVRSSGIQNRSALGRFVSTEPFGRGIGYSLTTLGIAVIALAVVSIGTRTETRFTRALQATGQTTLSLYLLHVVVYYVLFEWWSLVEPHGLSTALVVSGIFWIIAVIVATTWREHFGLGPAERVYRAIGG